MSGVLESLENAVCMSAGVDWEQPDDERELLVTVENWVSWLVLDVVGMEMEIDERVVVCESMVELVSVELAETEPASEVLAVEPGSPGARVERIMFALSNTMMTDATATSVSPVLRAAFLPNILSTTFPLLGEPGSI
jgi:hypothetical protein